MVHMASIHNATSYTPVGDILVMALVCVFAVLIRTAYIKPNREFRIFKAVLGCLTFAATTNIFYNVALVNLDTVPASSVYILRILYHLFLFGNLALYILYMDKPLQFTGISKKKYYLHALIGLVGFALIDFLGSVFKFGFYIDENKTPHSDINIFPLEYVYFVFIIIYLIIKYRDRVYRPIGVAFIATSAISVFVMYLQGIYHQHSFTTATFLFPAFTVFFLLHSNPYDIEMGTLRIDSFEAAINQASKKKANMLIISLFMHEFEDVGRKYPKEVRDSIRKYVADFFRGATVFQISGGRMILIADISSNPKYEDSIQKIFGIFKEQYYIYRYDYKLVVAKTTELIRNPDDYIKLIQYVESRMLEDETLFVNDDDIDKYYSHKYIVDQLADINEKKDLFDERVLVFCQPVYNLRTQKFDTAEALMRLKLEQTGMVFPDIFIPIAENHNYIHQLSLVILAKTCREVKRMLDEGYDIARVSVNFSILDVREPLFCENVKKIVQQCKLPFDKIAIEITESQNESDFNVIKEKIFELKKSGITFYLDDFGTGYSNFERIMELPFDIIKFDRSLVIASGNNAKSETMVTYLAHMFTDMNYSVLYEGIENEKDENLCASMYARYLQGYKYSKPIPIEQLSDFFEKRHAEG